MPIVWRANPAWPEVLWRLGWPAPEPEAASPADERRQLTILFSDLVGSTELSTQLDTEKEHDRVDAVSARTAHVVTRFCGTLVKYLDGVLTLVGHPQA